MDDMPDHRHRGRKNPEHGRQNSRTDRPDGEPRDGPRRTVNLATALAARARATDPLDGTGATRGVNAAYAHMSRTMTELGIHIPQEAPLPQPGPGEYAATAENLYHDLIAGRPSAGSTDGHVLIRLAQAVNRAWAELTLANGTSQAFHAGDIDG